MRKIIDNPAPKPKMLIDGVEGYLYRPGESHLTMLFKDKKYQKAWFEYNSKLDAWTRENTIPYTKEETDEYFKKLEKNLFNVLNIPPMELHPTTHILKTIQIIRESYDLAEEVYTKGSCVRFALLLSHIYSGGEILYDQEHAVYKYGKYCYDITGIVKEKGTPLKEYAYIHIDAMLKLKYKTSVAGKIKKKKQ